MRTAINKICLFAKKEVISENVDDSEFVTRQSKKRFSPLEERNSYYLLPRRKNIEELFCDK